MKMVQESSTIEKFGLTKTIKCGMTINSYAFKLLAEQYSNPIKAIVQEISANCYDAHVRAGKEDVPFSVKLPNKLDNHIRFRDYGVSMSPEKIENVYANYMTSDKRETNDEVGYFGIGSKTPLAYTDSFNVTTYKDGVMRMYTIGYDENNIPEINQYGEYPTEEPDGVEVSFAVKQNDFTKFEDAAKLVYSFYKVHPVINGSDSFVNNNYSVFASGNNWKILDQSTSYDDSYLVMGNIGYKLHYHHFRDEVRELFYHSSIQIEVPVGSVKITPSREELMYTDETIEYINNFILTQVLDDLSQKVVDKINSCESLWQARKVYVKIKKSVRIIDDLINKDNIKFNIECLRLGYVTKDPSINQVYKYYYTNGRSKRNDYTSSTLPVGDIIYVIKKTNQDEKYWDLKCRELVKEQDNSVILLKTNLSKNEVMEKMYCIASDEAVFTLDEIKDPNIIKRSRAGYKYSAIREVRFIPEHYFNKNSETTKTIDFSVKQDIVFIERNREHYFNGDKSYSGLNNIFSILNKLHIHKPEIIIISSKDKGLLKGKKIQANFIPFNKWISEQINTIKSNTVKTERLKNFNTTQKLKYYGVYTSMLKEFNGIQSLKCDHVFYKLMSFVRDYKALNQNNTEYDLSMLCEFDESPKDYYEQIDNEIIAYEDYILNKYKPINFILYSMDRTFYSDNQINLNVIVDTINAVDSFNKGAW